VASFNKPFVLARETAITRPLPGSVSGQEREILQLLWLEKPDRDGTQTAIGLQVLRDLLYHIHQKPVAHNRLKTTIPAIQRK